MSNVAFADEQIDEIDASEQEPEDEDFDDEDDLEEDEAGKGAEPHEIPHG